MKNHNKKIYFILLTASFLVIFFAIPYFIKETSNPAISPISKEKNTNSVTVSAGNIKINLSFSLNTSLYNILEKAKKNNKIDFNGKNYPGLGFFVTDVGTLHSGDGKNLLYYINGKEAKVGVSSYILNDGDIIEWKLK